MVNAPRFVKTIEEESEEKARILVGPKPEHAPNKILADLFGHPSFVQLQNPQSKAVIINFFKVLNKRKI